MRDAFQLYKENYQVTILYISGEDFQESWIQFESELAVEARSWGAIKNLYR